MPTRCKLGKLGTPLLGQRQLATGRVGWDVASLEFKLRGFGLPAKRVDGRFDAATAAALRRFQRARGLTPDGIAGAGTYRALARGATAAARSRSSTACVRARASSSSPVATGLRRPPSPARTACADERARPGSTAAHPGPHRCDKARRRAQPRPVSPAPTLVHVVQPGEGFIAIAERYGVRPTLLASANGLVLTSVISPGQRLRIPGRTTATSTPVATPTVSRLRHTVAVGESFFSISQRYHVSPWRLAQANRLSLTSTIVPGQRLALPPGARLADVGERVDRSVVSAAIDRWAAVYGVDGKLARALAWMESGFQEDVVSSAGAVGVMQLLPETWEWVDTVLLGQRTPRTYDGNVRAGVRYLRWQLDQFGGDVKLALAGYYQGARAVRERGLFDDTKQYVAVILELYGSV